MEIWLIKMNFFNDEDDDVFSESSAGQFEGWLTVEVELLNS